ncbi:MAG: hypothetical protein [Anelloviridae sp.]|nr:MAG: hypothetical protein [Anelloviridae sp.]
MPYWNYYRYRKYRPRQRRFWRRRPRRAFQRRLWRRKRRRVRPRKLKKLRLTEWQPQYIRKIKVHGFYPLFMATDERLSNNNCCYLESVAPEFVPGGGGFSICNFSLETLYNEHLILHNWWTNSNENMPLIRYTGATIKLYRQETVDYLFCYNRSYPMLATFLTYTSSHPQAMLLNKHTRKITCKQRSRNKKPYVKLFIKPPTQMQNKWYFQKDLAFLPLIAEGGFPCPVASNKEAQTPESSDTETQEAPLETQILQQRREQKLLRKRIQQLLNRLAILE